MNNWIIVITAGFLLIFVVSLFFLLKKKKNTIEIEEIQLKSIDEEIVKPINEPEIVEDIDVIVSVVEEKAPKIEIIEEKIPEISKLNINISSKTENKILSQLSDFENKKGFLNKNVNLNSLSKDFGTNTKYLSEIIKSYKNKNFNQYLNELRIDYLIDKLKTDEKVLNTKVSYLASDLGFNSHSSFSTVFTNYIGKSPSEYIKELKESKKS